VTLRRRRGGPALAAAALLALDALVRLVAGTPYVGATALLLAACGLALVPFLPADVKRPSLLVATLPAVAAASFATLLVTVSIVGVPLTELSIRLAVASLVAVLGGLAVLLPWPDEDQPRGRWSSRREWLALAALVAVAGFAVASSWDVADPLPARGTDWGHYLLYADEVAAQERLLADDPLSGEEDRLFADPPGVGALYGSARILDGISSWTLGYGLLVVSLASVLGVYAAVGALWGVGAGLAAAAAYAVAPIRLEPMYWHGLATTLALASVPLVVLALGLAYRGRRGAPVVVLLALALLGVAVAHSTSALVVAILVAAAVAADLVRHLVAGRAPRAWWSEGAVRPVVLGVGLAALLGAGVIAHLRAQAVDLGAVLSYGVFEEDRLELDAVVDYYSWPFLLLGGLAVALVLATRGLRRDPALLSIGLLVLAGILASQLWLVHVAFEYRRAVYYVGLALAMVIGVASLRLPRRAASVVAYALVLAYVAHTAVGLRLPERLLADREEHAPSVPALQALRKELDRGERPDAGLVVADRCLHFVVPYLLRRPTIAAFEDWQVGFANRVPPARTARAVIEGGPEGRRVAERLGVRYVVADPRCTPDPAPGLGATVVVENEGLIVLELPA
jgi:hypothetical protein